MKRYLYIALLSLIGLILRAEVPSPKHEIRAVWLTTIYGLDWPQKPATTEYGRKMQQQELCQIRDRLKEANFNMVFVQVRMRGDVIYKSAIEPASKTFSGKYGVMPGYDPLAFVIEECHKRGMECHAWMVTFPVGTDKIVKEYKKLKLKIDTLPETILHKAFKGELVNQLDSDGDASVLLNEIKTLMRKTKKLKN